MFIPGNDMVKARKQAQNNANFTGVPWVIFTDTNGNTCIEKLRWGPSNVLETVYPDTTVNHLVTDANDDTLCEFVIQPDKHGLSVTLPDGQVIVFDRCSGKVSIYHYSSEGDADPTLLGSFANGYAALEGK
jgi:hypothetical protein